MRRLSLAGVLASATALGSIQASAAPLISTLEFVDGPIASAPVTTGSVSISGLTLNGAPVVGSATQQILQLNGTATTAIFNPLSILASEYNLVSPTGHSKAAAAISGILAPLSTLVWSVYLDPANAPLGTAQLIASGTFTNPSSLVSVGFSNSAKAVLASVSGPFSLSEFINISTPFGAPESFTSSVTATAIAAPEPVSLAILGSGLLGLGLVTPMWRRRALAL